VKKMALVKYIRTTRPIAPRSVEQRYFCELTLRATGGTPKTVKSNLVRTPFMSIPYAAVTLMDLITSRMYQLAALMHSDQLLAA
jgi:hypothetical protein